jgi:adenosylhomocysteine nucleosidase
MIAILVAVKQELRPILRRARASHVVRQAHLDFYEGTLAGQPVALLALGIGKECARIAAEMTVKCYRPDLIISAGFGGGLQPHLKAGDIAIGTEILDLLADQGNNIQWRSKYKLKRLPHLEITTGNFRVHFGKIITTDEMILKAATKGRIGQATGALAVDMETSAVATVAAASDTDFMAVRCITDKNHEDLPEQFNDFFVLGQLRPSRVISTCARHPSVLTDLARLGYRAKASGQNLARFLEAAVGQLHLPALAARDL